VLSIHAEPIVLDNQEIATAILLFFTQHTDDSRALTIKEVGCGCQIIARTDRR
jgi:hypothetical protein